MNTTPCSLGIAVNSNTRIFYTQHGGKWFAKWRSRYAQGTWCGFGGLCKHAHDDKDTAIQCAIERWAKWIDSGEE